MSGSESLIRAIRGQKKLMSEANQINQNDKYDDGAKPRFPLVVVSSRLWFSKLYVGFILTPTPTNKTIIAISTIYHYNHWRRFNL